MIELRLSRIVTRGLLVGGALCIAFSSPAFAQVQTQTSVAHGQATHEVKIERGEIVYVSGNDVVIKMEDGSMRDFNNVPDSTTVTVDGKQLNVHQIKPGMKVVVSKARKHTVLVCAACSLALPIQQRIESLSKHCYSKIKEVSRS